MLELGVMAFSVFNKIGDVINIVFTWRRRFLTLKTKEPPKLLSPSGVRGGKFIFVYNFTAQ